MSSVVRSGGKNSSHSAKSYRKELQLLDSTNALRVGLGGLKNKVVSEGLDIAEPFVRHHLTVLFAKLTVFAILRLSISPPEVPAPRVAVRDVVLGVEPQGDGTWSVAVNFTRHRFL